ncbi:hypothetical protein BDA99DRAFT_575225 [Phascolomyces articulosus]|uniref:Uncharacterized protein n=1 Tax=Phascolomyces articulosus TaxID=60185 RepID=A0AAD5JRY8_9FUNG|nr:hypothetical protein BDA99DRAFT_575225 [Phascolomyces articulosus]
MAKKGFFFTLVTQIPHHSIGLSLIDYKDESPQYTNFGRRHQDFCLGTPNIHLHNSKCSQSRFQYRVPYRHLTQCLNFLVLSWYLQLGYTSVVFTGYFYNYIIATVMLRLYK